jgi:hypothetical protein
MPEFVLAHTQQWIKHFASEGHDPRPLAAGVEGAIYDLGSGLVAKVWRDRRPDELVCMQNFYADVASAGLPFSTPEILAVEQVDRTTVTYERKLPGAPLQQWLGQDDAPHSPDSVATPWDDQGPGVPGRDWGVLWRAGGCRWRSVRILLRAGGGRRACG